MAWNSLKDLTHKNLGDKGITDKVNYALILDEANKLIVDFLGPEAKQKARALYLKESTLTIAILHNSLVDEFNLRKDAFVEMLNDKLGNQTVKDIRFMN